MVVVDYVFKWVEVVATPKNDSNIVIDAILPRKGPFTRAMSKRLQKDWARAAEEGPRVLMNLRVDF